MSNTKFKVVVEHGTAHVRAGTAEAIKNIPAVRSGILETVINGKPVVDTLSQRPCNVILRKAMNCCADAFLPDRSELQERAEDADSVETMRDLFAKFIADMTEYGAMAGAHQLRKAAHAKEDDQVNAVMAAYKLIGAPGDFGYETPRGKTWYAVLRTYDAVLKERMGVLDAEAAIADQERHEVCQAVLADMDKEDRQTVINRLLEGLELIAEMPAYDLALCLPVSAVATQYEDARETARLTLDQYARNAGIVVDRDALDADTSTLAQALATRRACPVDGEECDRCAGCRTTACKDAKEKAVAHG